MSGLRDPSLKAEVPREGEEFKREAQEGEGVSAPYPTAPDMLQRYAFKSFGEVEEKSGRGLAAKGRGFVVQGLCPDSVLDPAPLG